MYTQAAKAAGGDLQQQVQAAAAAAAAAVAATGGDQQTQMAVAMTVAKLVASSSGAIVTTRQPGDSSEQADGEAAVPGSTSAHPDDAADSNKVAKVKLGGAPCMLRRCVGSISRARRLGSTPRDESTLGQVGPSAPG